MFLLTALIFAVWLSLYLFGKVRLETGHWRRVRWPLFLLGSVQLWTLLQTVPLPREWVAWLSPSADALHLPAPSVPLSLDVAATRYLLLQGMACTMIFTLVTLMLQERDRISSLLWTVVASGAFQAAYGTMMTLSGLEYGFFVEKYTGLGLATGTFINRNHLAAYLVMALAAGIGLLISRLETAESAATLRARLRSLLTLLLSSKLLLRLLLAVMVIGLVLTRSRMGNLSFFVALTVAGGVILLGTRQWQSGKLALLLASLLVVDLLIVGRWFGADEVAERLMQTSAATDSAAGTEVSGNAYARQEATFAVTGTNPTEAATTAAIEFPVATGSWGTVTYAAVYDAETGGNMLAYAELTDPADFVTALPKAIDTGDVFRISLGNLKIRLD